MKGYIPVEIPTKKYIKAYIITRLGQKPLMTTDNVIGCKLHDVLQHRTNERKKEFSKTYNDVVRIYVNRHVYKNRGCFLNETNLKNFNRFMESYIKDQFYFLMDFYIEIFPSFEENLPQVRKLIGIDDEYWSDESMRKDYYRYRKESGKPLLYKKNIPRTVPSVIMLRDGF